MGTFQSGINNILASTAVGAATIKSGIDKSKEMKAQADKEAANAEALEKKEVAEFNEKFDDAIMEAVGYSKQEIGRKKASKALGIEDNKLPKSIKQKTFDRRMANARAMEEIKTQYAQKAEYRKRFENVSSSDIAKAIKPELNKPIKKGGNN